VANNLLDVLDLTDLTWREPTNWTTTTWTDIGVGLGLASELGAFTGRPVRARLRASTQPLAATAGVLAARPCASTSTVPPGIYRGPDDCEHDVVIDVGGGSVERRSRALSGHRRWSRPRLPARGSQLRTQREHNVDPIVTGEDGRVVTPESRGRLAR